VKPPESGPSRSLAGIAAVVSLAACLVLPLWVASGGEISFAERLEAAKPWLAAATLLYLGSGTLYYNLRRRTREAARG
jgi:hypothetical protein